MNQAHQLQPETPNPVTASLNQKLASEVPPERLLLTRKEVAAYLGLSPKTLDLHGATRYQDLPFFKVGSRAMYRLDDVLAFVEGRRKAAGG